RPAPHAIVTPVIRWQVQAIRPMVRRVDDAAHVLDIMLAEILLVAPESVWRCRRQVLHVIVERIASNIPQILDLRDAHDGRFQEPVETIHDLVRIDLSEIPMPNRTLQRLNESVLAYSGNTPKDQGVIDFLTGKLDPMRAPVKDMLRIVRIYSPHEIDPLPGLRRIAGKDDRRLIQIEAR